VKRKGRLILSRPFVFGHFAQKKGGGEICWERGLIKCGLLAWIPMRDENLTDSQFNMVKRAHLLAFMLISSKTYKHIST